jgi:hypothetical protein
MIKSCNFRISQEPRDLLERGVLVSEIAKSEAVPQMVEDFTETGSLRSEVPGK